MKTRLLLAIALGAVLLTAWCFHRRIFQDDEKRIREIIEEMRVAAEAKSAQRIIEHFSKDYSDSGGNNKFIIFQMIKHTLDMVEEIRIDVKDVTVLVTGDSAWATVEVTSQAVKNGKIIFPFGSDKEPETPRITFKRTSTGDWVIVRVEDVSGRALP